MSQAAAIILKNVYQFAVILNQASNSNVLKWDNVSICNALNWADYCQELYKKLKGQSYEKEFNSQLAQMTMLLQPTSCLFLSLDSLENAKFLLAKTLIGNPSMTAPLRKRLTMELSRTRDGQNLLSKIEEETSTLKDTEELYLYLLCQHGGPLAEATRHKSRFQSHFLLCHLISVVSTAKKKDRFKSYCHALCDKLMQSQSGHEIFVNMFRWKCDDLGLEKQTWFSLVLDHLISWLGVQMQTDLMNCPLLTVDVTDVTFAASIHHQLLNIYLETLSAWADTFTPEIDGPRGLAWRSPTGDDCRALTGHFHHLLSALTLNGELQYRTEVIKRINEHVQTMGFTIWRSVGTQLLHLLKQG
ncbi:beta-1,4-mannosyltransferase egh [Plakobranchus ocellatus]|uniref:Beta-1,4-mannosyltransferase egh n=1 Tax=Plakobranchus ocellatus TaxID=259542 RepID=A0AAV3Y5I3_9GAST|nr:beta-1,4-mannosyltransferase egh [Plakobranchus ocellatus]